MYDLGLVKMEKKLKYQKTVEKNFKTSKKDEILNL